jgi:cytochrome b561
VGYDTVSRLFHWTTALLVLVMIPVGLVMAQEPPQPWGDRLFILHKGLGPVVLVVVLARLAWRAFHPAPPLPPSVPPLQRSAAHLVHAALYAVLVAMPVSGYVFVDAGDYPIEALQALGIPPFIPKNPALSKAAETVHVTLAFVLIALIAAHVGAAALHGLVRRDGVVARMWPPLRPRARTRA